MPLLARLSLALLAACATNPPPVPSPVDPACTGAAHPMASIGFGVEHLYEGDVAPGKHVKVVLSCDHTRLVVSGAFDQVIGPADITAAGDGVGELADLSGGELVVSVATDMNFDGFNDLVSVQSNGQGRAAIDGSLVFLYEPEAGRFRYHAALSALENVSADPVTREIRQEFCGLPAEGTPAYAEGRSECVVTRHTWEGGRLVSHGETREVR
ncbi:MAG: hypothetical protein V4850_02780 [Myxococcota bacterium]